MNERIRLLRRTLNLTQQEFGQRIGMKQNTIALIEGGRNTSDQTVFAICREFNVNEEWLRTGEGEMFVPDASDELEELAKKYHLNRAIQVFIEKLVNLSEKDQAVVSQLLFETAAEIESMKEAGADPSVAEFPKTIDEMSIDEKVAAYRAALETEEKATEKSEVS